MAPHPTTMLASATRPTVDRGAIALVDRLSPRERDVLQELVDGKAVDDGAAHLYVSRHTFRTHVKNIMLKFGSHSSLEVVSIAARAGVRPSAVQQGAEDPAAAGGVLAALACVPVPIAELSVDGRFRRANRRFEELVARSELELQGATMDVLTPSEDVRRDIDLFAEACRAGEPVGPLTRRILRGDGRVIWCEVTMAAVRSDGALDGVLMAAADVTGRLVPDALPVGVGARR